MQEPPHPTHLPADATPFRPLLRLSKTVLFPRDVSTLEIRDELNLTALEKIDALEGLCVVIPSIEAGRANGALPEYGVLARLVSRTALSEDIQRIVLQGLRRVKIIGTDTTSGCLEIAGKRTGGRPPALEDEDSKEVLEGLNQALSILNEFSPEGTRELLGILPHNSRDFDRLSDLAANLLPLSFEERAWLVTESNALARMGRLTSLVGELIARARTEHAVDGQMERRIRNQYLREKLEVLRTELNEPMQLDAQALSARLNKLALSRSMQREVERKLNQLRRSSPKTSESARIRSYLEWVSELPWGKPKRGYPNFEHVSSALSKSHVGLDDVKRRIFEFLAVRQLGGGARGTVLCFYGPPGTGKSSMGRAVASALGRRFLSIPLGAMTHEQEVIGSPNDRDGGAPGAILSGITRCAASDPIVLLDEIDKISLGGEGTAAGSLLQLLDPEQNSEFVDQYLGCPFDLSNCLFLATANEVDDIPEALLDRMEAIEFHGYTEEEKYAIAREHLLPRARSHAGVTSKQFQVTPGALRSIILRYTEEAGVRHLQRNLISLARKAAVQAVRGAAPLLVKKDDLVQLLGPRTVDEELRLRRPAIGVATGLAWTSAGGALLPIEALAMPGSGRVILTGQLGDVLRESVQTALSYVRTCFSYLGIQHELLENLDLHLHFPSAATPKDGPSAGVAIACALVSLLTMRASRHDIAMTGEVSLLGQVLGVGGIREKILTAIRSGIPEIILPARNAEEILRLSPEVRQRVKVHLIDDVREAFDLALLPAKIGATTRVHSFRRRSARKARKAQDKGKKDGETS
ncbi:MAG: endopeptidase La [Planctomycetes bacterium]|nr:endopeptidase La [Planctomycetota bacterium]